MSDSDPVDERRLIEAASRGDEPAIEALLERHLPGLRAYVRLRAGEVIRERESTSDLVQSVCREILEDASRFRFGGERGFKQWLYKTAMRKIVNRHEYYRAAKRDAARESPATGSSPSGAAASDARLIDIYHHTLSTPSRALSAREEIDRVERAFDRLAEEQREVIVLSRILGLSAAEIGETTGRSDLAVRKLLSRSLAHLAAELTKDAN